MQSSKQKSFHRTNQSTTKYLDLFNSQKSGQGILSSNFSPYLTKKNAGKSELKIINMVRQPSKRSKNTKPKSGKQSPLEKNQKDESHKIQDSGLKYFQMIVNSQAYQMLNEEYTRIKKEQKEQIKIYKKQIHDFNHNIRQQQVRQKGLLNLRQSLIDDINHLSEVYNDLKLRNYDLKCELNNQRGYNDQEDYYESVHEVNVEDLDYQQVLQLEEMIGKVNIGYKESVIAKMPVQYYIPTLEEQQEKCCICYSQFEQNEQVFTTKCKHIHHLDCLQKWLGLKRFCPLCRQPIILE